MTLHRLVTPYFVCGVVCLQGVVVEAAPIVHWMRGKPLRTVASWIAAKRGTVEALS